MEESATESSGAGVIGQLPFVVEERQKGTVRECQKVIEKNIVNMLHD